MNENPNDRQGISYPKFREQFSALDFDEKRKVPVISLFDMPERIPKEQATITATDLEGKIRISTWKDLKTLPEIRVRSPLICQIFNWAEVVDGEGWKLKTILGYLGISGEENKHYSFHSRDGNYFETLTHEEAIDERAILSYRMNGEYLSHEHGGPLRLIIPFLQGYKSVKWVDRIYCSHEDPKGIKIILKQSKTAKLSDRLKAEYNVY